jgi:hypothetical protein
MMTQKKQLAKDLLKATLNIIKKEDKIEGFAFNWLENIIELSYLNGFEELLEEAYKLRTSKNNWGARWIGMITNIPFNHLKKDNHYELMTNYTELEKKYTYQQVVDFLAILEKSNESYLFVKDTNQIHEAIQLAKDDYELETIACYLCIQGYFEESLKMIENELSDFKYRIKVVKIVMVIELFRRDEFNKAKKLMNEIYHQWDSPHDNLYFAKGILGYQPWGGYPFSDY